MRLKSNKNKEQLLAKLKDSIEIMDVALHYENLDTAFKALVDGTKAAKKLGFESITEAKEYYNL